MAERRFCGHASGRNPPAGAEGHDPRDGLPLSGEASWTTFGPTAVTRGDLWWANYAGSLVELKGIEPSASRVRLRGKRALGCASPPQSRMKTGRRAKG